MSTKVLDVDKIKSIQKENYDKYYKLHNIDEFYELILKEILNYASEHVVNNNYIFYLNFDDEDYQKYYRDNFNMSVMLLVNKFKNEGFTVYESCTTCGQLTVDIHWD